MRNLREYLWAESPSDALRLRVETAGRGAFLGGGTCLVALQDSALDFVVDLSRAGMDRFVVADRGLRCGATRTLETWREDLQGREFAGGILEAALERTRTEPWRRQATLAGRLLEADSSDLLRPCLLVLEAQLEVLAPGDTVPSRLDLETALAQIATAPAERPLLAVAIDIPAPAPGWGFALESVARSAQDDVLAAVAVGIRVADGRIADARIATSAVPEPRRAPHAESAARGCAPGEFGPVLEALDRDTTPRDDWRASAEYRSHLVRVLLGRALRRACAATAQPSRSWPAGGDTTAAGPEPAFRGKSGSAATIAGRPLQLHVNGTRVETESAPGEPLLLALRRTGFWSVKHGCESGDCGACLVLLDGTPRLACLFPASRATDRELTTVEALGHTDALHPLQRAFLERGAVQCGYCTPAMLLAAAALHAREPRPSEAQVRDAFAGILCRCTGYLKPVEAVLASAPAAGAVSDRPGGD